MIKNFRELLFNIHSQPIIRQRVDLQRAFMEWIGTEHSQIDDVLVCGIQFGNIAATKF